MARRDETTQDKTRQDETRDDHNHNHDHDLDHDQDHDQDQDQDQTRFGQKNKKSELVACERLIPLMSGVRKELACLLQ